MINPFKDVNWHPDRAGLQGFGRSLVIGFPVVAVVFFVVGRIVTGHWNPAVLLLVGGLGAALGALFMLVPSIARPFYIAWYGIACSIGLVVSNVLMASVFYGVFMPIGLALRLAGRNPLALKIDRSTSTYWLTVTPSTDRTRYFRQF